MIYLPAAPTIYTGACKRYTIPPAAGESKQAANKVERQVAGGCDGAKRRGCVNSMACRQPAATAWDQLLPVHGRVFFAPGGFRTKVGLQGLRNWARPGAGNDGGQGQAVVVVDRSGASTPHMGRARGLGTTWLMDKAVTLARGSKALLTNPYPPPGPSPKC